MSPDTPDKESGNKLRRILHFMNDEEKAIAEAPLDEIKKELRQSGIDPEALTGRLNSLKARIHTETSVPIKPAQTVLAGIKQTLENWSRSLAPVYSLAFVLLLLVGFLPLLVSGPKTAYRGPSQEHEILRTLGQLDGQLRKFKQDKDYAKATAVAEKIVTMVSQYRGAGHPDTAAALNNLALMSKKNNQPQRAVDTYLQAIAIQKSTLGANHKDTLVTMRNLLVLYQDLGLVEKAEQLRGEIDDLRR